MSSKIDKYDSGYISVGGIDCPCCVPAKTNKKIVKKMIHKFNRRTIKNKLKSKEEFNEC